MVRDTLRASLEPALSVLLPGNSLPSSLRPVGGELSPATPDPVLNVTAHASPQLWPDFPVHNLQPSSTPLFLNWGPGSLARGKGNYLESQALSETKVPTSWSGR